LSHLSFVEENLLLEGLLRSTDQRTVSVDQHQPVTIRGTQLGSRHLSLDSTLLDQRKNAFNLEALKSSTLSDSNSSNEDPTNDLEMNSQTEAAEVEIPEDEDDRIDRSGITDDVDESEDEFPIRGTIITPEEEEETTEAPINVCRISSCLWFVFLILSRRKMSQLLVQMISFQCLFMFW
jgi:hypothetical protein